MLSLKPLLPRYHFSEQHRIAIAAPASVILDRVVEQKAADDPLMRAAITLRELPARILGRPRPKSFDLDDFTFLGRHGDSSVSYGLTGAFWQSDYGLVEVEDLAAFLRVNRRDVCQLVMGFETRFLSAGKTQLLTETRVFCPSAQTRRKFAPYWYLIRPVSGLMRRRMLARIRREAEAICL